MILTNYKIIGALFLAVFLLTERLFAKAGWFAGVARPADSPV